MTTRQEWLDGLTVGSEVAVDFRTQGKGCKVYRVQEITETEKYSRVFAAGGMRFSPGGEYVYDDGVERRPACCCLEDPDSVARGWGEQPTRRQVSERWHIEQTFVTLAACHENLSTEHMLAMVRAFNPDYKPEW